MDVSLLIRHRLKELGLEQKDLAAAAQVTESYISQLLARKKAPPAPGRTDIYEKIGKVDDLCAAPLQQLRRRPPAFAEADDEDLFVFERNHFTSQPGNLSATDGTQIKH